jgi:glycosyltransferase involved in cell wall biosynthesis
MDVSIIVTTKNEEKNIGICLGSIKGQDYPAERVEIIVVDNNSRDKTKEIAALYTQKIYNAGPERSSQRNFGMKQASGKYILYLDADMKLSPGVIGECVGKCEKENYTALYIPEIIIGNNGWVKVRNFERSFYNATCIDAVRFVRKDKVLETGGFDESLTGPEDWDFDRRIKKSGKIGIINSPLCHDENDFSLKKYLDKKKYYSLNFQRYIDKWGNGDIIIKKQLGFWYRYFGVFIENGKFFRLVAHPVLTLKMYYLRFLVGVYFLLRKK